MQQALRCIHETAYFFMSKRPVDQEWAISTEPAPIPLTVPDGRELYLTATQSFFTRKRKGEWKVSTTEYIYNVSETADTRDYMIAWHWHPNQRQECHVHAHAQLSNGIKLDGMHLPSARISFEEVLRFLVEEFGVEPAMERTHALRTLVQTQERHEKHRSWWGSRKP